MESPCFAPTNSFEEAKGETLDQLREKMELAQNFVKRYNPDAEAWCEQYLRVVSEAAVAETLEKKVKEELKKYSESVFRLHEKRMNETLTDLGADFQILKWDTTIAGNEIGRAHV